MLPILDLVPFGAFLMIAKPIVVWVIDIRWQLNAHSSNTASLSYQHTF